MNRDILTVWQNTESPGTVLIGPGLLLLFVDYLFSNPNFFGTAFVEYYVNPLNKEDDGR